MLPEIRLLRKNEEIPYTLLLLADEEKQAIDKYIHQSDIYIAEIKEGIIGVYALYPLDTQTAEIKAIAVTDVYQNRGIGTLMLKHAATEAREKGYSVLVIGTPDTAEKQISIYQKAGFVRFDTKKDFFIEHYAEPIFENGIQLRDMAMLRKFL